MLKIFRDDTFKKLTFKTHQPSVWRKTEWGVTPGRGLSPASWLESTSSNNLTPCIPTPLWRSKPRASFQDALGNDSKWPQAYETLFKLLEIGIQLTFAKGSIITWCSFKLFTICLFIYCLHPSLHSPLIQ